MGLWERRATWVGRVGLAAGLAATVVWSYVLLGRTSDWFPALRPFVVVVGALGVVAILALPLLRDVPKLAVALVAVLGFGAALAAPLFSTVATAATAAQRGDPVGDADPGRRLRRPRRRLPRRRRRVSRRRRSAGPSAAAASPAARRAVASPVAAASRAGGTGAGAGTGRARSPAASRRRSAPAAGSVERGVGGGGGGGGAGFLNSSQSNPALTKALQADASRYTWAAATVNSNNAAGYQLASGEPVMAIGGFNGTDPAPTLAQFEKYVSEGKIHYFIASGGGFGGGGFGGAGGGGGGVATTRRRSPRGSSRTSPPRRSAV